MTALANNPSAHERSQRSVFVGNIPYEATEEDMKDLFSQVGQVVSFRLVLDRESGKPKGYGFCEFIDQDTAACALRNLNQFEFHGRTLRVDTAAGDRSREELKQMQMLFGGPPEESPFGPAVEPSKAPEAISKAVASLPPEQMFELMKQMKLCVQNNPNEARSMLLQNPQLAYALLQAQVVMRIVDPQVAMSMLHRENAPPTATSSILQTAVQPPVSLAPPPVPSMAVMFGGQQQTAPSLGLPAPFLSSSAISRDIDYRMMPGGGTAPSASTPVATGIPSLLSMSVAPPPVSAVGSQFMPRVSQAPSTIVGGGVGSHQSYGGVPWTSHPNVAGNLANDDQERAALIMQVLQLTDDQIALLPPDQKQSVLLLREQLRSAQQ